jgi:glutamate carboxypeptidase
VIRDELRQRQGDLIDDLDALVSIESPSGWHAGLEASAQRITELFATRTGRLAELIESPAGPHVRWSGGGPARVLLIGHHDTVHPVGSTTTRPFTVTDDQITGPGVFDMKAGIVQIAHALAFVDDPGGVEVLLTSDEEIGSGTSRALIEERALAAGAVLVFEPAGHNGAVKTARKGNGTFTIRIRGRASHAGLEPEKGINALVEAAHHVIAIASLGDPSTGTTVTPTIASAGTADNVVPDLAEIRVDVRIEQLVEARRVTEALHALRPILDGAGIEVIGAVSRPPMPSSASSWLFPLAQAAAEQAGLGHLTGIAVGGASDGNFTAAVGVATLDGLGAIGGGAHAITEHVVTSTIADRTALTAAIVSATLERQARR